MPLALLILSLLVSSAASQATRGYGTDSLILLEIADSLHVPMRNNTAWQEGGRVTRVSFYYQGQSGAVPPALGRLDSLRYIHMAITSITALPREIGVLKRMDTIDIGTSRIGPTLPDEIGDLAGLRCLRVSYCKLQALPSSLMRLRKLETVDFSHNSICQVEDSLRQWILAISPHALDDQNSSACPVPIPDGKQTRPGSAAMRRLYMGGSRSRVSEEPGPSEGHARYYTPIGRRVSRNEKK